MKLTPVAGPIAKKCNTQCRFCRIAISTDGQRPGGNHNYVNCKELLGYNVSIPEEFEKVKEQQLIQKICPDFVRTVAKYLETVEGI